MGGREGGGRVVTVNPSPPSVIMETDPGVLAHRIAIKVDDGEQSMKNVSVGDMGENQRKDLGTRQYYCAFLLRCCSQQRRTCGGHYSRTDCHYCSFYIFPKLN